MARTRVHAVVVATCSRNDARIDPTVCPGARMYGVLSYGGPFADLMTGDYQDVALIINAAADPGAVCPVANEE